MSHKCKRCNTGWNDGLNPCCWCGAGLSSRIYIDDGAPVISVSPSGLIAD